MFFSADQILGCLVGGALGDALGGPYEGRAAPVTIDPSASLVLSDDTQLTLATCEALVESTFVSPEAVARHFAAWFRAGRITGMGASTLKALTELAAGAHWALSGRTGEMGAGNGAAMRAAPLAFCLDPNTEADRQLIRQISRITHQHDEAYAGALAMILAIRAAADGLTMPTGPLLACLADQLPDTRLRDRLVEIAAPGAPATPRELARCFGCSGYVVESVPLAICAAQRWAEQPFTDLLSEVISVGGDTDTIAALTGQIAGGYLGFDRLPEELIAQVAGMENTIATARRFTVWVQRRAQTAAE